MSDLRLCDSIRVLTQSGENVIELLVGDITKLQKKDKVDVLFVSAFYGDYTPTVRSLIGALKRNLGVNVGELARDKEEDLRKSYSCWWSRPLPDNVPFNRVLCFETKTMSKSTPQEMVADAYRCLVAILGNKDGSVITPLLNTGDQGYGKVVMIRGMVEAAIRWMKAGLALRRLKIVLFSRSTNGEMDKILDWGGHTETAAEFCKMKEKYDMQYMMPKHVTIEFDVYLSYSDEDQDVVDAIVKDLKDSKSDVRIFSSQQKMDAEAAWQEDMYEVMMKSARVITVLSPSYMDSAACLEQYNIALCCTRKANREMLAPFYVVSLSFMPTYMGLVQYVDCRFKDFKSITEACKQIAVSLSVTMETSLPVISTSLIQYDVFLSYSHNDSEKANQIVKLLQEIKPDLKIFFDVQELKTGKAWQRALYHSIDGSRCLIALITSSYLKSAVCQEEYNLAVAKHYDENNQLKLIPVLMEDLDYVPLRFSYLPMVSAVGDQFDQATHVLCSGVVHWLETGEVPSGEGDFQQIFGRDESTEHKIDNEFEAERKKIFHLEFPDEGSGPPKDFPPVLNDTFSSSKDDVENADPDIMLSYEKDDKKYADFLQAILKAYAPGLLVKSEMKNDQARLECVERARYIVPLFSPHYMESPEQVEEVHIAIWRQRMSHPSAPILMPIQIHVLPVRPTYFHLLPIGVSLCDSLWPDLVHDMSGRHLPNDVLHALSKVLKLRESEEVALYYAVHQLLKVISQEKSEDKPEQESARPALLNLFNLSDSIQESVAPTLATLKSVSSEPKTENADSNQIAVFSHTTAVTITDVRNVPQVNSIQDQSDVQNTRDKSHKSIQEDSKMNGNEQHEINGEDTQDTHGQDMVNLDVGKDKNVEESKKGDDAVKDLNIHEERKNIHENEMNIQKESKSQVESTFTGNDSPVQSPQKEIIQKESKNQVESTSTGNDLPVQSPQKKIIQKESKNQIESTSTGNDLSVQSPQKEIILEAKTELTKAEKSHQVDPSSQGPRATSDGPVDQNPAKPLKRKRSKVCVVS